MISYLELIAVLHSQRCLTMKRTEDAETATLTTLFHVVRKGSRFLVTGLIRVVFTEASYSGRVCSPSSKWLREEYRVTMMSVRLLRAQSLWL